MQTEQICSGVRECERPPAFSGFTRGALAPCIPSAVPGASSSMRGDATLCNHFHMQSLNCLTSRNSLFLEADS